MGLLTEKVGVEQVRGTTRCVSNIKYEIYKIGKVLLRFKGLE